MTKSPQRMDHPARFCFLWLATLSASTYGGCNSTEPLDLGTLEPERSQPERADGSVSASLYTGSDALVQEAQDKYYDGFALHAEVIRPTCGPINGVCHNAKEYPDLHTPANFVDAVDAPCNVQAGTPEGVYDRCERPGDRLRLNDTQTELEIGYIEYIPGEFAGDDTPTAESPGLHIWLAGSWTGDADFRSTVRFIRTFVNDAGQVQDLPFFSFNSRFWVISDAPYAYEGDTVGTHLLGQVRNNQTTTLEALLSVGIIEGDKNRNGILGARHAEGESGVRMITPGQPEASYLVGRMRGSLAGEAVPGTRMPLANDPLDNAEMLALYCFIEGLATRPGPVDMAAPIDYEQCSYSATPEDLAMLGTGVTWSGRIQNILEFNCGGCHSGDAPSAGLNLLEGDVYTRLLEASAQVPELPLVTPGQPLRSYLWLKLIADPSITGQGMPIDPLSGTRELDSQELADIRTWIEEGALATTTEPDEVATEDVPADPSSAAAN